MQVYCSSEERRIHRIITETHCQLVSHCRGELFVGIKILDSILWIKGTVKKRKVLSFNERKYENEISSWLYINLVIVCYNEAIIKCIKEVDNCKAEVVITN